MAALRKTQSSPRTGEVIYLLTPQPVRPARSRLTEWQGLQFRTFSTAKKFRSTQTAKDLAYAVKGIAITGLVTAAVFALMGGMAFFTAPQEASVRLAEPPVTTAVR